MLRTKQWILFLLSIYCAVCATEEGSGGYLPNITLETRYLLYDLFANFSYTGSSPSYVFVYPKIR
jgi:hypothetical protein